MVVKSPLGAPRSADLTLTRGDICVVSEEPLHPLSLHGMVSCRHSHTRRSLNLPAHQLRPCLTTEEWDDSDPR